MKLDKLDTILYCVSNEINKDYIYLGIERIEFLVLLLYIIYIMRRIITMIYSDNNYKYNNI